MNQLLPKILIFLTFFGSCIVIGLLLSALVTSSWVTSNVAYIHTSNASIANEKNNKFGFLQFGLFHYNLQLNYGFGLRFQSFNLIHEIKKYENDEVLGNYYLWLFTALGTGFSLFASSVAAVGSVIATIKEKGGTALMMASNIVSGIGQFVALACWILQFVYYLQHNVLLPSDQEKWSSKGRSTFGYSFYFIVIAFVFILINIILLISARRVDKRYRKSLERPLEEKEGNSIMLY